MATSMNETKPKAGEPPSEHEIAVWWFESLGIKDLSEEAIRGWIDNTVKTVNDVAFARRVWRECRERTLEEAAKEMQKLAAFGHNRSVTVAQFVEWCASEGKKR